MDAHVFWLRQEIIRSVATALLLTYVATAATILVVLLVSGVGFLDAAGWAIAVGLGVVGARLALALTVNPLTPSFLSDYIADPPRLDGVEASTGVPNPIVDDLWIHDLQPIAAAFDERVTPPRVFDLLWSSDRTITASIGRESSTVVLVSAMEDGRILCTSAVALPPHRDVLVNFRPGAGPGQICHSHRRALKELAEDGVDVTTGGIGTVRRLLTLEHEAYRGLGPTLGCFLDIEGAEAPHRLSYSPSPAALWALSTGRNAPRRAPELVTT